MDTTKTPTWTINDDKHFVQNICSSSTVLSNMHFCFLRVFATKRACCKIWKWYQRIKYIGLASYCTKMDQITAAEAFRLLSVRSTAALHLYLGACPMDNLLASCAVAWTTIQLASTPVAARGSRIEHFSLHHPRPEKWAVSRFLCLGDYFILFF